MTIKEEVQQIIDDEAEMTAQEIAELIGRPRPSVRRTLLEMEKAGKIGRVRESRVSVWMRRDFVAYVARPQGIEPCT